MKILKITLRLLLIVLVVGIIVFLGLAAYDNFVPRRAKDVDVEFCKCLKEYKGNMKCGKYGFSSRQSAIDYDIEKTNLFIIVIQSPSITAKRRLEEMKLQWELCQSRFSGCLLCDNKQQDE